MENSEEIKHRFHVLAVDDSQIDRKLLERLLTVSSYQVTCVESGDKALEYLGLLDIEENHEYETTPSLISTASKPVSQPEVPPVVSFLNEIRKFEDPIYVDFSQPKINGKKCLLNLCMAHFFNVHFSYFERVSKINLIITDYNMPGISGYDLLKRVKDSSWKDIPVVVMSSENVPSRINKCMEGGAEEFFLKPVTLSDLSKLHSHLLNSITDRPRDKNEQEEEDDEDVIVNNVSSNKRKATSSIQNPRREGQESKNCMFPENIHVEVS